jgi:hypothetical protein
VRLGPAESPERKRSDAVLPPPEAWEALVPDTDRAYTVQQMAQAWKASGQPIPEDDAALSVDPDDYPLF